VNLLFWVQLCFSLLPISTNFQSSGSNLGFRVYGSHVIHDQWYFFLLGENFATNWQLKEIQCNSYKGFFLVKKMLKEFFFFWNHHIFYNRFQQARVSWFFKFSTFLPDLYSQIWLIPFLDNCKCGYITKLRTPKKKIKKKNPSFHNPCLEPH